MPGDLFPNLYTLRLQEIDFTPIRLASIESFSQGITTLELISTTNNYHLLALHPSQAWPALDSLTFLAIREATSAVSTLTAS
ncbi:hypothetical protein C8R45DRAFT_1102867 [Mycena sanguinolenta]|nr:hypothetical protein C8R45DRAFT_1102867 [Mycena sanguinolenta]